MRQVGRQGGFSPLPLTHSEAPKMLYPTIDKPAVRDEVSLFWNEEDGCFTTYAKGASPAGTHKLYGTSLSDDRLSLMLDVPVGKIKLEVNSPDCCDLCAMYFWLIAQ